MVSNRLKQLAEQTAGVGPTRREREAPGQPKAAPTRFMAEITGREEAEQRAQAAESRVAELEAQLKAGGTVKLPVAECHVVPGRRRTLSDEAYAELRENLRQHPMIHPIVVRPRSDGSGYDIMSGSNRRTIYAELGFTEIDAVLARTDPETTDDEELAFYANLLSPDLTDFEKYLGLVKITERSSVQLTHEDLAQRTGLLRQTVSKLLKFGELPEATRALLENNPAAIGLATAAKLAALTGQGKAEQVTAAVEQVVNKAITQEQAVAVATARPHAEKPAAGKTETIRRGRTTYCKVKPVGKTLRLDFESEEERARVEAIVLEVLRKAASESDK